MLLIISKLFVMNKTKTSINQTSSAEMRNIHQYYSKNQQNSPLPQREMKKGKQMKRINTSPGPGAYNIFGYSNSRKGVTISSAQRSPLDKEVKPDPWSYIPNNNFIMTHSPKATIGRERKFEKLQRMPGPADYKINYNVLLQRMRRPVIGKSEKQESIEKKPGPADYNTIGADQKLKRNISVPIGTQPRDQKSHLKSPAPNQYKIDDEFSQKLKNRIGFTMGSRFRCITENEAPINYLKYNVQKNAVLKKAPAFTIQRSKKCNTEISVSPGPAAYSPKSKDKRETHGIVIPKSERTFYEEKITSNIGIYQLLDTSGQSPAYSIPRANQTERNYSRNEGPGPGDYTPLLPLTGKYKSIGMGYGSKYSFTGEQTPGPGDYNLLKVRHRRGITIGHGQRQMWETERRPGPADYHTDYSVISKLISNRQRK